MPRAALAFALLALVALVGAAPASAHRPAPKRPAVRVVSHGDRIPRDADRRLRRQARRARARAAAAIPDAPLAPTWCGAPTAADDIVHQAAAGNAIKVVYAHPADVPDNFASGKHYADVIAAAIKLVQGAFLDATGGARTVRFDVGTSCGANYLDIQSVTLPRPASAYSASDTTTLTGDLKPLVTSGTPSCPTIPSTPGPSCTRDFLVFADGIYKGDGVTGVATRRTDPTAGAANRSNYGGLFAYVLGDGSPGFGISTATTAEHELLHNLGAVQGTALHSTGAGHCFDAVDVMCYPDGGARIPTAGMLTACPGALASNIDCGHDDYFNPDGPVLGVAGTPIWNIDDSTFLCALAACVTGNLAPVASFTATSGAHAGDPVTFDASGSTDEAGPPASFAWDVDGDGVADGQGATFTYTYAAAGTYTAQLTVTDVAGARATTTRTVVVAPPLPPPPPPAPAPAPAPVAAPAVAFAPLGAAIAAAEAKLRRLGGLRALVRGRGLRVGYTPPSDGRLAARLVLGRRTIASAGASARAGRPAVATLRLGRATRRALRRTRGNVRVRLAYTPR